MSSISWRRSSVCSSGVSASSPPHINTWVVLYRARWRGIIIIHFRRDLSAPSRPCERSVDFGIALLAGDNRKIHKHRLRKVATAAPHTGDGVAFGSDLPDVVAHGKGCGETAVVL